MLQTSPSSFIPSAATLPYMQSDMEPYLDVQLTGLSPAVFSRFMPLGKSQRIPSTSLSFQSALRPTM